MIDEWVVGVPARAAGDVTDAESDTAIYLAQEADPAGAIFLRKLRTAAPPFPTEWTDYGRVLFGARRMKLAARYRSTLSVRLRSSSPAAGKSHYVTICRHSYGSSSSSSSDTSDATISLP